MNNQYYVNETMLMEIIWRELESMRRVRAANEYYAYLASMQFTGPIIDKLFNNTCEYLIAMASVEGVSPDVVMEQAAKDSIQAHIAHYVENNQRLLSSFSPTELAGVQNYAMRKVMVDTLIDSVTAIERASAPLPGEKDVRGKRRRRGATTADNHGEAEVEQTTSGEGRRRRRRPGADLDKVPEVQAPTKRPSLRESIRASGETVTQTPPRTTAVAPTQPATKPTAVNHPETGNIIKRIEGQPMDYNKHQTVKIFDTAKNPADRPKNFEANLRMAPIVRPVVSEKLDEPTTIEVLHPGDSTETYKAVPLLKSTVPLLFSIPAACLTARGEIRNSEFNVPGRQSGIVEFEVVTPIQYFDDPTSAQIAINEHYLHPLLGFRDQTEYGLVEWHSRLEHAIEMSDSSMATSLLTQLDRLATAEFNNFLKYTLGMSASVDSFVADFHDFYKAVSKSMTVPVLDALLGEMVDGVRKDDVAGSMLVKRIADIRIMDQSDISANASNNESGVALCIVQPITVLALGANASEMQFATTSSDYNSITAKYVKDEPHVISGILRMFTAALQSRKESSVYLISEDNEIFHIRDMTRIEKDSPVLHLGIKYITNPFVMA